MQPRRQPPSAPWPGPARPYALPRALLPLLLLLALRGAAVPLQNLTGTGPRGTDDPRDTVDPWGMVDPRGMDDPTGTEDPTGTVDPRGMDDLTGTVNPSGKNDSAPPSALSLQQAARVALHFLNFQAGSPSELRMLTKVQAGSGQADPMGGYRINVVFSTQSYHLQDSDPHLGKCSAQVFYQNQKPRPAIMTSCSGPADRHRTLQQDHLMYEQLKQMNALDVGTIPDNHGNIDPSVRPIWDLAVLGSSYVMWEKTTLFLYYYPLQLSSVTQWKTNDHAIDFDYIFLLHEFPTQEVIPCHIHLIWYPGKPTKVNYHCEETQTPEGASSGTEEGSAVAPTERNF